MRLPVTAMNVTMARRRTARTCCTRSNSGSPPAGLVPIDSRRLCSEKAQAA